MKKLMMIMAMAAVIGMAGSADAALVFDSFTADAQYVSAPGVGGTSGYATGAGVYGGGRRVIGLYNEGTVEVDITTGTYIATWADPSYQELNYGCSRYNGVTYDHPMNLDLTGSTGITFVVDAYTGVFEERWYVRTNVEGTPTVHSVAGHVTGVGINTIPWASFDGGAINLADVDAFSSYVYGVTISEIRIEGLSGAAPIPEPAGLGLIGLALLAVRRRRS